MRIERRTEKRQAYMAQCLSCSWSHHPKNNADADNAAARHARANPDHSTVVDSEITTHYRGVKN